MSKNLFAFETFKDSINFDKIFTYQQFDENIELNAYLNQIGKEILMIEKKSELILGQKFQEVFKKIGRKKGKTYKKFVEILGFNYRTTLRYRIRYNFYVTFLKLDYQKAKDLIVILPTNYLEKLTALCKIKEIKEYLYQQFANPNISLEEMKNILDLQTKLINIKYLEKTLKNEGIFLSSIQTKKTNNILYHLKKLELTFEDRTRTSSFKVLINL